MFGAIGASALAALFDASSFSLLIHS